MFSLKIMYYKPLTIRELNTTVENREYPKVKSWDLYFILIKRIQVYMTRQLRHFEVVNITTSIITRCVIHMKLAIKIKETNKELTKMEANVITFAY